MERSGERLWGAIREENKLAFFLPEWVNIMDLCISMGPPAARELYPISETIDTKLSAYSVCSSDPELSRRGAGGEIVFECPCLSASVCG